MISSEVQRTLVKSPPELWTELSDPESLARHLGELGEITITRTEPENLVEWEAEGTTGTVEIAPSGWGTRVKLTVVRELADGQAEAAEPEAEGDQPAEAETPSEPQALAAAAEDAQPEAGEQAGGSVAIDPAAEVETQGLAAPGAERKPGPATEAARRAAGWPSARHEPGPAIESDLRAAEAADGPPPEPDGLHDWAAQSAEAEGAELREDQAPEDEAPAQPEPRRRGLFARLFGRRRERAKKPQLTAEDDALASPLAEMQTVDPGDSELPAGEGAAGWDEPAAPDEAPAEPATQDTELGHADLAALGEPEPRLDEIVPAAVEPEPAAGSETEPEQAGTAPAASELLGSAEQAPEIFPAEPEALEQAETEAAAEPEQTREDPRPATPAPDLAAELRAAEEVASEQVEAVLTAVLDRLGSAHHRPFSRP